MKTEFNHFSLIRLDLVIREKGSEILRYIKARDLTRQKTFHLDYVAYSADPIYSQAWEQIKDNYDLKGISSDKDNYLLIVGYKND